MCHATSGFELAEGGGGCERTAGRRSDRGAGAARRAICRFSRTACCWVKSFAWRPIRSAIGWSGRLCSGWATRITTWISPGRFRPAPRTYIDLLGDLIDNLLSHGFRRIVFLNGHGGNIVPAGQAIFEARQRYRERIDLLLLAATYWSLGSKPQAADPSLSQDKMGHACEWETSMMLHLAADLVGDLSEIGRSQLECRLIRPRKVGSRRIGVKPGTSATLLEPRRPRGRPCSAFFRTTLPHSSNEWSPGMAAPGTGEMGSSELASLEEQPRNSIRPWVICALMLLATMLNYMDRLALSQQATEISRDLNLTNEDYAGIEEGFGIAFAIGGVVSGLAADRINPRWLYPGVLLCWSLVGCATGWVTTYRELLVCRVFLGFFEAGQWPCRWSRPSACWRAATGRLATASSRAERRWARSRRRSSCCALRLVPLVAGGFRSA